MFSFKSVRLAHGSHKSAGPELCVMEAVAYIAGEKWSRDPCTLPCLIS